MAGKLPQPFKIKGTLFSVLNTEGSVIKIAKKIQGPNVGIQIFIFLKISVQQLCHLHKCQIVLIPFIIGFPDLI